MIKKWINNGLKYFIIFQDTNSLAFESIPTLLGCSVSNNIDANYLTVKRYEGEKASILCSCEEKGREYKIKAIDYSLLKGLIGEDINNNNKVFSSFPAVTNIIYFNINNYFNTLTNTNNKLPEYILCNSNSDSFRLETVLQDYVILTDENSRIKSTYMPRWLCFNPVKDIYNENDFYTPDDGERKLYTRNKKKLSKLGWEIGEDSLIYIDPLISYSIAEIKKHFTGNIRIENKSKLVVEGNVYIDNLHLYGSLIIKTKSGGIVKFKNLNVINNGYDITINEKNYYKKKIISKGELVLEYGDGIYEIK